MAAAEHDADEDVPETAMQEQEQHTSVPEASAVSNDDPDVGGSEHMLLEEGVQGSSTRQTEKSKHARAQLFQVTVSVRDDWLHRRPALYDMDLKTYVSHVEREEKPLFDAATSAPLRNAGLLIPFEAHYKLAGNYAQRVKLRATVITRYVGPNCERETVNEGEENAAYKACLCSLLRCPGPGQCSDPLMCRDVLFTNAAGRYCFRPHWRAREAEILVLALRAHEKKLRARRVEVLTGTTLCKGQSVGQFGIAPEHIVEAHEVLRMFR